MRLGLFLLFTLALLGCGAPEGARSAEPSALEPAPAAERERAALEGEPEPPTSEGRLVVGDDPCESDADCVPADCCHAAACVAQGNAPACGDVMCTMECRADTMDCGGGCLCHEGRCAARLADLEAPSVQ